MKKKSTTIPVAYRDITIGCRCAKLPIVIWRDDLAVDAADASLCGRRLTGRIVARPEGVAARQGVLFGADDDTTLAGVFMCRGFRVSATRISATLLIPLDGIDAVEDLDQHEPHEEDGE